MLPTTPLREPDAQRIIEGMAGRRDLNGRNCVVMGASPQPDRMHVQIVSTGEEADVKTERLWTMEAWVAMWTRKAVKRGRDEAEAEAAKAREREAAKAREEARKVECERELREEMAYRRRRLDTYFDGDPRKECTYYHKMEKFYWWQEVLKMRRNAHRYPPLDQMPCYFDPTDPMGGYDEDGAPWGAMHPFYDYGDVPAWVLWHLLRERVLHPIVLRHTAFYWDEITRAHHMAPGGALAAADANAFETDMGSAAGA